VLLLFINLFIVFKMEIKGKKNKTFILFINIHSADFEMSTRRGEPARGPPRHQNKVAFKHNKNSKRTQEIADIPVQGLCRRCHDQIEWRKRYRKYKPLTVARRCSKCQEKTVGRAYHNVCDKCARDLKICAKCSAATGIVEPIVTRQEQSAADQALLKRVDSMSERKRRAFLRKHLNPDGTPRADHLHEEDEDDDDDDEDDDEEDEEEDEEDEDGDGDEDEEDDMDDVDE
jgi:hypothetical protein